MIHKFAIGEKAIIIRAGQKYSYLIGKECTIVAMSTENKNEYVVDVPGYPDPQGGVWSCTEASLRKPIPKEIVLDWKDEMMSTIWVPEALKEDKL